MEDHRARRPGGRTEARRHGADQVRGVPGAREHHRLRGAGAALALVSWALSAAFERRRWLWFAADFAALVLLSLTGVVIYAATSLISHLLLRKWHESAVRREN